MPKFLLFGNAALCATWPSRGFIDVRNPTGTLPPMKIILLALMVIGMGCGNSEPGAPASPVENNGPEAKASEPAPTKHTKDSLETIQQRLASDEAILLDVREKDEWDLGHLKAAMLTPLSVLEEGEGDAGFANIVGKLSKDKIIYCHCVSGGRVMPASKILHQLGYDVRPLKPGYDDLVEAGFEDVE
ncbi:MAG: rhodanese-like domain-containing protein [Limisphaerales bacterium]|nr:MAG: rhodanese-like domain-containing protein [Limisphaerales bacterium]